MSIMTLLEKKGYEHYGEWSQQSCTETKSIQVALGSLEKAKKKIKTIDARTNEERVLTSA